MIQDIHSHSYYSDCGKDDPRDIINAAINGGITHFGICDHNYGIGERKEEYLKEINALKEEYKDKITIYCGIEIATCNDFRAPKPEEEFSRFDYCLLEHVDNDNTVITDLFEYAKALSCPVGIAHTDIFGFCERKGFDVKQYLADLARHGIFWEMNVNYDSIHGYREHEYVPEFMNSKEQQRIVKESGIRISVGFDGHRVEDYSPDRVIRMNKFLDELNINRFVL